MTNDNPLSHIHNFTHCLDKDSRLLFLTMLMCCMPDGEVFVCKDTLMEQAGLRENEFEKALQTLISLSTNDVEYTGIIKTADPLKNTYTIKNYSLYREKLIKNCYRLWARSYMKTRRKKKLEAAQ